MILCLAKTPSLVFFGICLENVWIYTLFLGNQSINQSINQKITIYKSDQWCTTHLKTKIKPKDNVQKVKTTQR